MRNSRILFALTQLLFLLAAFPAIGLSQRALGISIADLTQQEGNGGFGAFLFQVSVVRDTAQTAGQVTMSVSAASGGARVGSGQCQAGDDVILPQTGITIPANSPSVTLSVTLCSDTIDEADAEQFTITLSNPSGASIARGTATGTISDDDPMPRLRVSDANANEGNAGAPGSAAFLITLNTASGRQVTVVYNTQGGNATAGAGCGGNVDYASRNATAVFDPGVIQQTVTISYCGDAGFEGDETFSVVLSNPQNATIEDPTGAGRINNDDPQSVIAIAAPLTQAPVEGTQSNTPGTLGLTNSIAQPSPISVSVVASGTAIVGANCTGSVDVALALPIVVQWAANDASPKTVNYTVCGDSSDDEDVETFTLTLNAANGAAIAPAASSMTLSITDDDASPTISVGNTSVTEPGNGGPLSTGITKAPLTITLSAPSNRSVSMTLAALELKAKQNGILPATAGSACSGATDFLTFRHQVSFAIGATTTTIQFNVCGDPRSEGTGALGSLSQGKEMFQMVASAPSNATFAKAVGLVLILDP